MTTPMDPELRERLEAQAEEYGTYVAKGPIYVGTALAYPTGGPVPVSNVERHKYAEMGLVVKVGTKEHAELFPSPDADTTPTADETQAAAAAASAEAASTTTTSGAGTTTTAAGTTTTRKGR